MGGAEIPSKHVVDGRNLKTLLAGKPDPSHEDVFVSHFPHKHTNSYFTSFREGDWKLVYNYFPDSEKGESRYELYLLSKDPSESNDLSKKHPERVKTLTQAMIEHLDEMEALFPMLDGVEQRPEVLK